MTRIRRVAFLLALGIAVTLALPTSGLLGNGDFREFYCAGVAVREQQDPYLAKPLFSCEQKLTKSLIGQSSGARPAPLPGYDFALLFFLTRLSFTHAAYLWSILLLLAYAVATWALSRIASVPLTISGAALLLVGYYECAAWGQIPLISIAAACLSAYALKTRRFVSSAIVAALSMVEPHLGLPVCLSLFLWEPKCRITLLASAVVLAAISVGILGWSGNIEYFRDVLPAHSLAETQVPFQYSLTFLAHVFGASDALAVKIGSIDYLITVACAIAFAPRFPDRAGIVLVPFGLATLGGVFMHRVEMAAAIPLAVFAARLWPAALAPLITLSIYWYNGGRLLLAADALIIIVLTTWGFEKNKLERQVAIASGFLIFYVAALYGLSLIPKTAITSPASATGFVSAHHLRPELASTQDGLLIREDNVIATFRDVAEKLPCWLALLFLAGITLRCPPVSTINSRREVVL